MKSENVKTREDFILFLKELDSDFQKFMNKNEGKKEFQMSNEWAHIYVGNFLEGISAWLEDSREYKKKNLTWKDFANIIESGKYYE